MENETLIQLVEIRKKLYDVSDKDYKNNGIRKKLWNEIAQELNTTTDECQKRWKRLKEKFYNFHKKPKSGSSSGDNKVIPNIIKCMGFLKPYGADSESLLASSFTPPETISNDDCSVQSYMQHYGFEEDFDMIGKTEQSSSVSLLEAVTPVKSCSSASVKRKKKNQGDLGEMGNILEALKSPEKEFDEIDHFCFAIAKDIKKMPIREQKRVKLEISKIVFSPNIEEENIVL